MREIVRDLFAVRQVDTYDGSKLVESYKYSAFSSQFIDCYPADLDNLVDAIVSSLRRRQLLMKSLQETPISKIKDDLKPNTYKWIEAWGITNLFELRRSLHRRYNGKVSSRIAGIGQKNGTEIINVIEKHGIPSTLFTERWE